MFSSFVPFRNMKSKIVPYYMNANPSSLFCILPRDDSSRFYPPGTAPIYLNVYDICSINRCISWTGLGAFHTGLEVHGVEPRKCPGFKFRESIFNKNKNFNCLSTCLHGVEPRKCLGFKFRESTFNNNKNFNCPSTCLHGVEYGFGCHQESESGVFEIEPRKCPGFKFREAIFMGTTKLTPSQVQRFIELQSNNYYGDTYHLFGKNCNHFCEDMCYKLTGNKIPKWVNRLARIGSCCRCILPSAIKGSSVKNEANSQDYEKRSLTGSFSCFTSFSTHCKLRKVSISSLYKHSLYKGCLPPWEMQVDSQRVSDDE